MNAAYVDTSALAAIAFGERDAAALAPQLDGFDRLLSSNLLEAELRAAFMREKLEFDETVVAGIEWVLPERPLTPEFAAALGAGYLRGADLWHVATALYISPDPRDISFVTVDARQGTAAEALGFVPLEAATSP